MKKLDKNPYRKQNKIKVKTRKKIPILNILFLTMLIIGSLILVLKNTNNIQNIFTKNKKLKALESTNGKDLNIGDIVYYNHKKAVNKDDEKNQKVSISKGDSKNPGFGKKIKTTYQWKKYNVNYTYTYHTVNETLPSSNRITVTVAGDRPSGYTNYRYSNGKFYLTDKEDMDEGVWYATDTGVTESSYEYDYSTNYSYKFDIDNEKGEGKILYKFETTEDGYLIYYDYDHELLSISKVEVKTKTPNKSNYIGVVESTDINSFPKDGVKNGYWYEYIGEKTEDLHQEFDVNIYNTTWKVWDKKDDGSVTLISNRTVAPFETGGAVGHIWWEHNAHKISSIFGYGFGSNRSATQDFEYKVGSGIDNAPDMTEGDKGNWKIGEEPQDKINISGARCLTFPEVEEKLGLNDNEIKTNKDILSKSSYGIQSTPNIDYVVQRDIGSSNQKWGDEEGDKKRGKAKNNNYKMTDKYYVFDASYIPPSKYKDILLDGIDSEYTGLATNGLSVSSSVLFSRGSVDASGAGGGGPFGRRGTFGAGWNHFVASNESSFSEDFNDVSIRIVVFLKANTKYLPVGSNEWDIYPSLEDKDLKLKVLNLSLEPASKIGLKVGKASTVGVAPADAVARLVSKQEINGKIEYTVKAKKFDGQKRNENTTGDNAKFSKIDNKYNVEITGIPSGYDFKIIGKTGKQIDLDTDTNLEYELVIYPKAGTQNVQIEYVGGENDSNFAVTGNVAIKSGNEILGRKDNVTLKRGVNIVSVDNVDLFDKTNNTLKNYTVEFEKSGKDKSLHTVSFNPNTKKLVVTYVSLNREITVSVSEDSKKYLTNITEIKLKLVGGEDKNVTLKPIDFTFKLTVPERDKTGKVINYSLQKVENIPGYYVSIDGFNVNLKPILKLPYTGTELSSRNIAIIALSIFGIALAFRFRKKLVLIFKEYTMMK